MRRTLLLAIVCAACRTGIDADALVRRRGPDGAAEVLRERVARDPRDAAAWRALATVEAGRARPGAALAALEAAEALGAPLRHGLDGDGRAALGRLLVARARARVARGSPGAHADLRRARGLGAAIDDALGRAAALAALAADFAHVDTGRRAAAAARLSAVDAALGRGLTDEASDADVAATAAWLATHGARRAAFELLDRRVEERLGAGRRPSWGPPTAVAWLTLRRWWSGTLAPIDRTTIDAIARDVGAACAYAEGPSDRACDVVAAAGAAAPDGPPWEPSLVEAWDRDGFVAVDGARAAAWMIVAARAVTRGQRASWERAVRDHVDLDAALADPMLPPWARTAATAIVAGEDGLAPVAALASVPGPIAALAQARSATSPSMAPAEAAAYIAADDPALTPALAAIARAYAIDPALADRRAAALVDGALDAAVVAPALGRLFAALGDAPRARAAWQVGFDASPDEPALAEGLALAMIEADDVPAGEQLLIRAAAASGDAAGTYLRAARFCAAGDQHLAAIAAARWSIELGAPGDEDRAAAIAAASLTALGRPADEVRALATTPAAFDLTDDRAEVARRARDPGALIALARAADPGLARLARVAWRRAVFDGARARPAE